MQIFRSVAYIGVAIGIFAFASVASAQEIRNRSVGKAAAESVAGSEVAPPTNVDDILAVLKEYKPDAAKLEEYLTEANKQPPVRAGRMDLQVFYHRRGIANGRLGRVQSQLEDLRLARQSARKGDRGRGDFGDINGIMLDLALAELLGGSMVRGMEAAQLIVSTNASGNGERERYWTFLGRYFLFVAYAQMLDLNAARGALHDVRQAYAYMRSGRRSPNSSNELVSTMFLENSQALMLEAEGNYPEAEDHHRGAVRRAHDLLDLVNSPMARMFIGSGKREQATANVAYIEYSLANNLSTQGRGAEAEFYARSALKQSLEGYGRYSSLTALTIRGLGRIVFETGRFLEAAALARAAVESFEQAGTETQSWSLGEARLLLGDALLAQGRWMEAAAAYAERDRALATDTVQYAKVSGENVGWGLALLRTGNPARALAMLEAIYRKRLGVGHAPTELLTAQSRGFYAMALAANGQNEKALIEFQSAVPVLLEDARRDGSEAMARQKNLAWLLEGYMGLLVALTDSRESTAASLDAASEAFRIADVARGSAVQKALAESVARATPSDPALATLARKAQDTEQRYGSLSDILNRLISRPPQQQVPKVIAEMKRDIDTLRDERAKLKLELQQRFPEYADLVAPKPVSLAQAQAALAADEALISVYVGADQSYVWAVPKVGTPVFASVALPQAEVADRVAQLRKALDVGSADLEQLPQFDLSKSYELYSKLLAPVEAGWKEAKNLVVVPHKALGQLPFALLATAPIELPVKGLKLFEGYRQVPWLIRKLAVTQLPSVNTLVALRRLPAADPHRKEFIGFGDPLFSKEMAQETAKMASVTTSTTQRGFGHIRSRSITKVAAARSSVRNSARLGQLSRLEDTAEEIKSIAGVLNADPSTDIFLGRAASEKNVLSGQLYNRRIVMFATHGLLPGDLDGLTQPALALSAPEVTGNSGENGLLTTDKVLGLKLNADWVVLSACNTASGDGAGSEAVSGLGRAFFFAGARTILVSNWPVETVSAKLLTTKLFEHQVNNPNASRAEALRATMLDLIDKSEPGDFTYSHPIFWAPFSLVGDGGR